MPGFQPLGMLGILRPGGSFGAAAEARGGLADAGITPAAAAAAACACRSCSSYSAAQIAAKVSSTKCVTLLISIWQWRYMYAAADA